MRTASIVFAAILFLGAVAARAQDEGGDTPSLLPLPAFAPPPLPRPAGNPVALQAQNGGNRGRPDGIQPVWQSGAPVPSIAATYAWDEPTEATPSPSQFAPNTTPSNLSPQGYGACSLPGGYPTCQACQTCPPLGGSPYAQALNTSGMPPLNLPFAAQFQPGFWFGSLAGLVMTRDNPNALSTTYNSSNVNTNLLDTAQAKANWAGGGQVMFGRWWGPQAYGFQFVYWGLGPMTGSASVVDPNYQLSTPFNLGNVNIGQQSATFYFDNAHTHALWRSDSFNNFEWNAMRRAVFGPSACRLMWTGFAGVRYFRFQDGLIFGGVNSTNFSDAGGAYAAYLNTNVTNDLAGIQLGSRIDYFISPRVRLYAQPMVGLFGNQVSMREHLYSGDGAQGFDVMAHRSTVSTLGQIDIGGGYQITPRFSAFAAYRLMGITRVGLADNQIPAFWADQQGMQNLKTNGDLILHGIMLGGMWNF